ncbi:MAG: tripartite tricarboxylate transporter substrate binding protein [Xanthobacteraceae bacterium]|nr:tripartite tricarboxylate transporter substrate binding protein [Xanthobacteraceae bacterium]
MTPSKAFMAIAAFVVWTGSAAAQDFPVRPITIVVPFPAGGISDQGTRIVAQKASESLGQPVVIDNRGGAGGNIGAVAVKNAPADGYTLYLANVGSHAINQSLYSKLPFDPIRDFAPVIALFEFPHVLAVPLASPAKSVRELVDLAKARPGGLAFASQGIGAGGHLLAEMFMASTGIRATHVPYRGSVHALPDLVAGRVDFMFDGIPGTGPLVKEGRVRALAAAAGKRPDMLPDLPTMAEAGYPGIELSAWFGLAAPAGTPKPVIDRLNAEFTKALKSADVMEKLSQTGARLLPGSPADFAVLMASDTERLGNIVKVSGVKID